MNSLYVARLGRICCSVNTWNPFSEEGYLHSSVHIPVVVLRYRCCFIFLPYICGYVSLTASFLELSNQNFVFFPDLSACITYLVPHDLIVD
jgi:hypothetical protein